MGTREVNAGRAVVEVGLRDKFTAGLTAMERRMSSFGRSVATFGAALGAAGFAMIGWPLKMAAQMEQTAVAFEVMVGSATEAKKLLTELKTFAANTPFGFTDVAEAAKLLMNYGIRAYDVIPMLKLLGDVSLGNAERLNLLTLAFGQVVSRGKLTGDNLKQLTESGFNPLRQMAVDMAKKMGATGAAVEMLADKNMPKLQQAMEDGKISVGDVTRAFISATSAGGRFNDSMNKQSQTGIGLWSKLLEVATYVAIDFGTQILEALKPALRVAISFAEALQTFIAANTGLVRVIGLVAVGLTVVGAALTGVGVAAMALSFMLAGLKAMITLTALAFSFIFSPLGLAVVLLIAAGVAAFNFRKHIAAAFAQVVEALAPVIRAVYSVWQVFKSTFEGIIAALLSGNLNTAAAIAWFGFVATAWTAIDEFGSVISTALSYLEAWIPGVGAVRDSVVAMFAGIGDAILAGRWDLAGAIMMAKIQLNVAQGWANMSNLWAAASTGIGTIWDTLVYGIRTGWHSASTFIASSMLWVVGQVSNAITSISNLFDKVWTDNKAGLTFVQSERDKLWADYEARKTNRNKTNEAFNAGAQKNLREDAARTQAGINADYNRSVTGRVGKEQATRDANAARVGAAQAGLADLEAQAAAARGGITVSDRAKSAREALDKAMKDAAAEREKAGSPNGLNTSAPSLAAGAGNQLSKIESRGTFSAAAALTFGARSNAPEETARNTGRAARLLQVIADKPGPQFT